MRRNSPRTGWPSISSWILCVRSPSATASITRATSIVGRARLSIELVDRADLLRPRARRPRDARPLVDATLATHDLADPDELPRHLLVALDELVERRGDAPPAGPSGAQPDARSRRRARLRARSTSLSSCASVRRRRLRSSEPARAVGAVFRARRRCAHRPVGTAGHGLTPLSSSGVGAGAPLAPRACMPIRGAMFNGLQDRESSAVTPVRAPARGRARARRPARARRDSRSRPSGTRSPSQRCRVSIVEGRRRGSSRSTISVVAVSTRRARVAVGDVEGEQAAEARDSGRSGRPRARSRRSASVARRLGSGG